MASFLWVIHLFPTQSILFLTSVEFVKLIYVKPILSKYFLLPQHLWRATMLD